MANSQYPFRKDDDSIVWLDFEQMMDMDPQGFLTLPDGSVARRARDLEPRNVKPKEIIRERVQVVSDSLGFIEESLPDMRAHLKQTGLKGVEFVEDPDVPRFYQVHCSTEAAKLRYAKSRGMVDRNSRNGSGSLGEFDLRNARELIERKFSSGSIT